MHSGPPNPGLHRGQPEHPHSIAREPPAQHCASLLVETGETLAVPIRQAVGLEGSRERVTGVAFVERKDAATVVVHDQAALDELHDRLATLQRDYLVSDGLAEYADALADLRARLPRRWRTGALAVAA